VLHLKALAHEAGVEIDLGLINEVSEKTPHLCSLSPGGEDRIEDLNFAGGIPAVMKELSSHNMLNLDPLTVTGESVGQNLAVVVPRNQEVIRPVENPYHRQGGLAVLFGNLAPEGCVVKQSAVLDQMLRHQGPARVFNSEEEATEAILNNQINKGDVIVIRYEGPSGGPGMREMLTPTSAIAGMGLDETCALITDGRFSGGSKGASIGHVSPEATEGGLIAVVEENDEIKIDIPAKTIELLVSDDVIRDRFSRWTKPEPKIKTGYMARYARMVSSAGNGAVFKDTF
jgi:dihydroxy-acid dehydratase